MSRPGPRRHHHPAAAASFLVSNDADRAELAARLAGRGTPAAAPNSEVFLATATKVGGEGGPAVGTATKKAAPPLAAPIDLGSRPLQVAGGSASKVHYSAAAADAAAPARAAPPSRAAIHDVATFLLRNDTDREELVGVLRKAAASSGATRGAFYPSSSAVKKEEAQEKAAAAGSAEVSGVGANGVYGMKGGDVFNELLKLETPALSTAPILSKL